MLLSPIRLFATPWTVALQTPLSMGVFRQEYWSELLFPSPGDLPDPGIEPRLPKLQVDSLPSEPPGKLRVTTCERARALSPLAGALGSGYHVQPRAEELRPQHLLKQGS